MVRILKKLNESEHLKLNINDQKDTTIFTASDPLFCF